MDCPICQSSLHLHQEEELHLHSCPEGHGNWFDGNEISQYIKRTSREKKFNTKSEETFTPLPGNPVKACPQCSTMTLEGGHVYGKDVRHCFTCRGVFIGHPLPTFQESLNPTSTQIVGLTLEQIFHVVAL